MKIRKLCVLLMIACFCQFTFSQNQKTIDSLKKVLKSQHGKEQFKTLHELSIEYLFYDTKLAQPYIEEELAHANSLNDEELIAEATNIYGVFFKLNSEYNKAIEKFQIALGIYERLNKDEQIAKVLNNMASVFRSLGDYQKSFETHMKALKIKESTGADLENLAASYWNIGNVQGDLKNYEVSNEWYKKAANAYKSLNLEEDYISIQTLLAYNYSDQNEYEKALQYFEEAIIHYKKVNQQTNLAGIYDVTGNLYFKQGDFNKAKEYYQKSIEISKNHDEVTLTAMSIRNLGRVYHEQKKYEKALNLLFTSLKTFEAREAKNSIYNNYHYIANVYESMGDYKQAFDYYKKFSELKNEVFNSEKMEIINELEIKYQTEKKESEIALQQEQIITLNTKAQNDKLVKTIYSIGMFSFLAIAGLLYFGFKQRLKRNTIEREKQEEIYKQEIDFKKKELASQTLHLVQKNTFIQELKDNLERIKETPELFKVEFRRLVMLLKKESAEDKDWEIFKSYFSEVHNNFDYKIKALSNDISEKEIRLASFLRMNLSTKEIASMFNVLPDSVLKSKYRLKKKLSLDKEDDLTQFLNTL